MSESNKTNVVGEDMEINEIQKTIAVDSKVLATLDKELIRLEDPVILIDYQGSDQSYETCYADLLRLIFKKKEVRDKLASIEIDIATIKEKISGTCIHPFKVDPRFNVCGVCYGIIERKKGLK